MVPSGQDHRRNHISRFDDDKGLSVPRDASGEHHDKHPPRVRVSSSSGYWGVSVSGYWGVSVSGYLGVSVSCKEREREGKRESHKPLVELM